MKGYSSATNSVKYDMTIAYEIASVCGRSCINLTSSAQCGPLATKKTTNRAHAHREYKWPRP